MTSTNGNDSGKCINSNGNSISRNSYKYLWGYFDQEIKWFNAIMLVLLHIWTLYAILTFDVFTWKFARLLLFHYFYIVFIAGFGVTAGAHRYYTHKCYEAKLPLRIFLVLAYTAASENKLYDWVRDHRVHHKYSETDADPHNSTRGFFFSHCGWLMLKKRPEVLEKGRQIDCSDILRDPVVQFQQKYFFPLVIFFGHVLPIVLPMCWDNVTIFESLNMNIVRWVLLLNGTWSVNSAAHLWGNKPYDKRISPVETKFVSFVTSGEGFHNYHHTFPWDYRASEMGYYLNTSTLLIDFFAKIGWAYNLKQPSPNLIKNAVIKYGDGSHFKWGKKAKEKIELCTEETCDE